MAQPPMSPSTSPTGLRRRLSGVSPSDTAADPFDPPKPTAHSFTVEDVTIPPNILRIAGACSTWQPRIETGEDATRPSDSSSGFHVIDIALEQQYAIQRSNRRTTDPGFALPSKSMPVEQRNTHRHVSLPALLRSEKPKHTAPHSPSDDHALASKVQTRDFAAADSQDAMGLESTADIGDDNVLFRSLQHYALSQRSTGHNCFPSLKLPPGKDFVAPFEGYDDTGPENVPNSKEEVHSAQEVQQGRSFRSDDPSGIRRMSTAVASTYRTVAQGTVNAIHRSSIYETYEKAKLRGQDLQRKRWVQTLFEYTVYLLLLCFVYFVLIGVPLWKGAVWWLYWVVDHKFTIAGTWSITIGLALL